MARGGHGRATGRRLLRDAGVGGVDDARARLAGAAPLRIHPAVRLLTAPDTAAADEALSSLLGAADHRRASLRRHPEARRRTRIGRGLVRLLAADLLGIAAEEVVTGAGPAGAPYARAPGPPEPRRAEARPRSRGTSGVGAVAVSVTHTRGLVAAAASAEASRLGVDVERLDRRTRPEAIARRHFLPAEVRALLALPEPARPAAFLRAWTLKEAWGKAAGVAVPGALSRIGFNLGARFALSEGAPSEHTPTEMARTPGSPAGSRWRFWTMNLAPFTLAAAGSFPEPAPAGTRGNQVPASR